MNIFGLLTGKSVKITLILLLSSPVIISYGQDLTYNYFYRVYFKDKGESPVSNYSPEDLFSSRAVARRLKSGIIELNFKDLPVNSDYIAEISSLGFKLHCTSRWMNTALFKTQTQVEINQLLNLSSVWDVKTVKTPGKKSIYNNKLDLITEEADLPPYDRPLTMINGSLLHNAGFDGHNILIAILDGGFINAENIPAIDALRKRNGIKDTYDFVNNNKHVFDQSNHGTAVLSVLAGKIPGWIDGTAPGADYLLLRTEDVRSEFPCEEDFWAAGAEYADSAGADIISSSLGYCCFDDPDLNYKHSELDGNTAFVTQVADIAASKGILVVNSAGNERNKEWIRILFPSDGDSVLSVGAVAGDNLISAFSSAGPAYDGRIKPDISTQGVSIPVQISSGSVTRLNGTSFSCPVLSGMAACLMQAVPEAVISDIIVEIQKSADRFNSPDSLYGYGIPDFGKAISSLQDKYFKIPDTESILSPNPTSGNIDINFRQPPVFITFEIISMTGKLLFKKNIPEFAGRVLSINELKNREQGIYFIRLITANGTSTHKIIKLNN